MKYQPELLDMAVKEGEAVPRVAGWTLSHARPRAAFWLKQLERLEVYNGSIFKKNSIVIIEFDQTNKATLRILKDFAYLDKIIEYKAMIAEEKEKCQYLPFHDWLVTEGLAEELKPIHCVAYQTPDKQSWISMVNLESKGY